MVPACEVKNKVLRDIVKKLAKDYAGLNDSGLDDDLFAGVCWVVCVFVFSADAFALGCWRSKSRHHLYYDGSSEEGEN